MGMVTVKFVHSSWKYAILASVYVIIDNKAMHIRISLLFVCQPGVPMEIALNKESKRKTPAAVSFRHEERTFGEDALTNGVRFPATNYFYLLDLLGKKVDSPIVELYKTRFPFYTIQADEERGTVVFRYDEWVLCCW